MTHNHEGVTCDSCLQTSFRGKRYKCLVCYDFDLCSTCYDAGITIQHHNPDHPMQCILSRAGIALYFGGEENVPNIDQPQSFTCPYCGQMGFTMQTLFEHASKEHNENVNEVICPLCVATPGEDPNRMTDDLVRHIIITHHSHESNVHPLLGEDIRIADVRRVPNTCSRGGRTRSRRANMQISPVPLSRAFRDSVDPIAHLLSHLSDVRRSVSNTRNNNIQQMQMRWHLEREDLNDNAVPLPLDKAKPRCNPEDRAFSDCSASASVSTTESIDLERAVPPPEPIFLLPKAMEKLSTQVDEDTVTERRLFVEELLMSSLRDKNHNEIFPENEEREQLQNYEKEVPLSLDDEFKENKDSVKNE